MSTIEVGRFGRITRWIATWDWLSVIFVTAAAVIFGLSVLLMIIGGAL